MNKNDPNRKPFGFPYDPYPIQSQLMNAIYNSAEQGSIAIFESPTGTGKSLSTICAVNLFFGNQFRKLFWNGFIILCFALSLEISTHLYNKNLFFSP